MIVTAAGTVAVIAVFIAIAAIAFGNMPHPTPIVPPTSTVTTIQSPATATAQVDSSSQPAPSSRLGTGAVASDPLGGSKSASLSANATPTIPASLASAGLGTVVVDAGHQAQGNSSLEPVGPGSSTKKPKVESGASGIATGVDESQRNLEIALKLEAVLKARGIKVVMIRRTQNVDIPNSERAQIANKNHAALFVRLHCDSGGPAGILTLEPGKDWYADHPIVAKSAVAARLVHNAALAATGAHDRGIQQRTDLSGFNWSQVPSVLVEMGMMSNAAEDRKLGTPAYQSQLANGMANGIIAYLKSN